MSLSRSSSSYLPWSIMCTFIDIYSSLSSSLIISSIVLNSSFVITVPLRSPGGENVPDCRPVEGSLIKPRLANGTDLEGPTVPNGTEYEGSNG